MTPCPPRAVVFDLDGTLIDSAPDIARSLNHALSRERLAPLSLETVRGMIGDGVRPLIRKALNHLGECGDPDRLDRLYAAFQAFARAQPVVKTTVYDGMTDLIGRLRAAGVRVGACTNKTEPLARLIVDALGLGAMIEVVVGGDGPYPPKPDPTSLLAALGALSVVPARAVYVGDMRVDWLTATAAKVSFLGVDHGHWPALDPDLGRLDPARGANGLAARLLGA